MEPKCIVLDEPTAMLDPNGRKEVIKLIRRPAEDEKSNGDPDHPLYGRSDTRPIRYLLWIRVML